METNPDHQFIIDIVKDDRPGKFSFHYEGPWAMGFT